MLRVLRNHVGRAYEGAPMASTIGRTLSHVLSLSKPALSKVEGDRPKVVSKVESSRACHALLRDRPCSGMKQAGVLAVTCSMPL